MGGTKFPDGAARTGRKCDPSTGADTMTRPRRWLDRLFDETSAARLGVTFESVEPGIGKRIR